MTLIWILRRTLEEYVYNVGVFIFISLPQKSQSKSSVSEMKAVVKPHPLFIQIEINQSGKRIALVIIYIQPHCTCSLLFEIDDCTISLAIRYIPSVGVACVSISGLAENGDDNW